MPRWNALTQRIGVALVALAATLGLAACGGQAQEVREGSAYAARVNPVARSLIADDKRLASAISPDDGRAALARQVDRLAGRIATAQQQLRTIRPPRGVAAGHQQLISALQAYRAALDEFRATLDDRDLAATVRAKGRFDANTKAFQDGFDAAVGRVNAGLRSLAD